MKVSENSNGAEKTQVYSKNKDVILTKGITKIMRSTSTLMEPLE